MIGHQAIRMYGASETLGKFREIAQVCEVIAFLEEARLPIDSALNDVQWKSWHDGSCCARHG
jgi:hypothetical protein